jgi:type III secretion protein U
MSDTAEKDLPASQRKLNKARERGEVANSADFVGAFTFTAVAVTMVFLIPRAYLMVQGLFERSIQVAEGREPFEPVFMLSSMTLDLLQLLVMPLLVIIAAATLSNLLVKQGLPLSMEPLMPKLSRISPGAGFGNIFSKHSAVSLLLAFLKFTIWSVCAIAIIWWALPAIMASGACGAGCIIDVSIETLRALFIAAIIIIIIGGCLDVPIQIMLFLSQQKMSKEERKKEYEDSEGKPEIKQQRREIAHEMAQGVALPKEGLVAGSAIVTDGNRAVALMFRQGIDEIPAVLARGEGLKGADLIRDGRALGLLIEEDAGLTQKLYKKLRPGDPISQDCYQPVALLLVRVPPRR